LNQISLQVAAITHTTSQDSNILDAILALPIDTIKSSEIIAMNNYPG